MKRADPSWSEQKGVMQSTGTDFKQTLLFLKKMAASSAILDKLEELFDWDL